MPLTERSEADQKPKGRLLDGIKPMHVSFISIAINASLILGIGIAIGFPISKFFEDNKWLRLLISPGIGLGVFAALAATIFHVVPLRVPHLVAVAAVLIALSNLIARQRVQSLFSTDVQPGIGWMVAAFGICVLPVLTLIPQLSGDSVGIGAPIFDHAKVAVIDEIVHNGLPVHNPFFSVPPNHLNYYYLWYFVAACASVISGVSGWEADIAMTGVTALVSILIVGWLAAAYSKTWRAAWWVLALLAGGSIRIIVETFAGDWATAHLSSEHPLEAWIYQAAWVPQHLFAAVVALIAILAFVRILTKDHALSLGLILGSLVATAYASSVWIGGIGLAVVLPLIGVGTMRSLVAAKRPKAIALAMAAAAISTLLCAGVFLYQHSALLGQRKLLDLWTYPVLASGPGFANSVAYWVVLLVLDFGLAYILSLAWVIWKRDGDLLENKVLDFAFLITLFVPLACAQNVHSVIANNDFGWRIVLPSVLVMTVLAANVLTRVREKLLARRILLYSTAIVLIPTFLSSGMFMSKNSYWVHGTETQEAITFRRAPELWKAVRDITPIDEAVANNPMDSAKMTDWPSNIGWALLSQRRNCAAGLRLLWAYAPQLSAEGTSNLIAFFVKVFDGDADENDLRLLKEKYLCRTLVVVPSDGLWDKPILNNNSSFKLVSQRDDRWRLYR